MPTGQFVVDRAHIKLTLLNPAGSASPSDSQTGIDELNEMWAAFSIDEGLIYATVPRRYNLPFFGAAYYRLGPSVLADWNGPIPSRIYKAYYINVNGGAISNQSAQEVGVGYAVNDTGFIGNSSGVAATYTVNTVDANGGVTGYTLTAAGTGYLPGTGIPTVTLTGVGAGFTVEITGVTPTGQNRKEINVVSMLQLSKHGDLSATALTPDEVAPDWALDQDGFMRFHLWPIPLVGPTSIELHQGVNFTTWSLTENYEIPFVLLDNITWALAARLISSYSEVVSPTTIAIVNAEGIKAEARLREYNRRNRGLLPGEEQLPGQQQQPQS